MKIPATVSDASLAVWQSLREMKRTGDTLLEFEPGIYDFRPENAVERVSCVSNHDYDGFKQIGLSIQDFKNLTVDGHGAQFLFHDVMLPAEVVRSENILLKNFSVDYPLPYYAHATCVHAGADYVSMKVWDISPYIIENNRLYFITDPDRKNAPWFFLDIDPETDTYRTETSRVSVSDMNAAEENGIVTLSGAPLLCIPHPGDILCFHLSIRYAPGIFIEGSKNVTLDHVTLHHALGMGVLAQVSENITLESVNMLPSAGRYMSVCDDGAHFVSCRGDVILHNCDFEKHFDDTLNIHGIYMQIEHIYDRRTILGRLVHSQQLGVDLLHTGEHIELIDHESLLTIGKNRVETIEKISRHLFLLTLSEDIGENVRESDCLESIDAVPNLSVTDCRFFAAFPRGLLITTRGKVRIERNYFRVASAAIHISGDANNWFESGCVRDVLIRDNTFDRCGIIGEKLSANYTVINISPQIQKPDAAKGYYHENIRIEGNRFVTAHRDVLKAVSAKNVTFTDNTLDIANARFTLTESDATLPQD